MANTKRAELLEALELAIAAAPDAQRTALADALYDYVETYGLRRKKCREGVPVMLTNLLDTIEEAVNS